MFLLSNLLFLTGFVSLFGIPSYKDFILVHIFLSISLFFSVIIFLCKSHYSVNREERILMGITILYYASTMVGTINSGFYSGLLTSQLFLMTFLLVFIAYKINNDLTLVKKLLKGFVFSGIATSLFCIADSIYFYSGNFNTLNNIIWPEILLSRGSDHGFLNLINLFGVTFFRPSGLFWDPGITITGVTISFIIVSEEIIKIKLKKIVLLMFFIAIILSISKTSIIALFLYFVLKIFQNKVISLDIGRRITILSIVAVSLFLFLLYVGLFIPYNNETQISLGSARHLKYFASLFYFYKQNIFEMLFGYGYTGVGVFFVKYIDWIYFYGSFNYLLGKSPESTLTNIFLYGGIVGSLFWIFTYVMSFLRGDNNVKILLLILIPLCFGYTFSSVWFNMVYFIMIIINIHKQRQNEYLH